MVKWKTACWLLPHNSVSLNEAKVAGKLLLLLSNLYVNKLTLIIAQIKVLTVNLK